MALPDKAIVWEELKGAWEEFADLRKSQMAEYHLLKREIMLSGSLITITLSNPIEEPLLHNIRTQLTNHLRSKLNNNSIAVQAILVTGSKKVMYTNKEKFDHLIEKNPLLKDLKEKLGLDPDF